MSAAPACTSGVQPWLSFADCIDGSALSKKRATSTEPLPHATRCSRFCPVAVLQPRSASVSSSSSATTRSCPVAQAVCNAVRPLSSVVAPSAATSFARRLPAGGSPSGGPSGGPPAVIAIRERPHYRPPGLSHTESVARGSTAAARLAADWNTPTVPHLAKGATSPVHRCLANSRPPLSCLSPFPISPYASLTLSSRYRASLRARRSSTTLAVVWRPQPQPAGKQRSGSARSASTAISARATWRCFFMRWICRPRGQPWRTKGARHDENGFCFLTFRRPCRGWHRSAWLPRGPQPEAVRSRWGTPASSRQEGVNSAAWVSRECREEYWSECSNVQTQPGADGARKTRQGVSSRSVTLAVSGSRKLHHSK